MEQLEYNLLFRWFVSHKLPFNPSRFECVLCDDGNQETALLDA